MNEMKIAKKVVLGEAVAILVTVRWYCWERGRGRKCEKKETDFGIFYFNFLIYLKYLFNY